MGLFYHLNYCLALLVLLMLTVNHLVTVYPDTFHLSVIVALMGTLAHLHYFAVQIVVVMEILIPTYQAHAIPPLVNVTSAVTMQLVHSVNSVYQDTLVMLLLKTVSLVIAMMEVLVILCVMK